MLFLLILMSYTADQGEHEVDLAIGTSDTLMGVNFEFVFSLLLHNIFL